MGNPLHSVRKEWEKRRKSVEHQYFGDLNGAVTNSLHVDEARILTITNVINSCHYHSRLQKKKVGTHWIYPPPRDSHRQDYYIFSVRNLYKSSFAMITGWGVDPMHTFKPASSIDTARSANGKPKKFPHWGKCARVMGTGTQHAIWLMKKLTCYWQFSSSCFCVMHLSLIGRWWYNVGDALA